MQLPDDGLASKRGRVLEALGIGLEHHLRDGPLPPRLLSCMRVVVASEGELDALLARPPDASALGTQVVFCPLQRWRLERVSP